MNPELKQARVDRFVKDEMTKQAVFEVLRDEFMKPKKNTDVQYLAASRIAIDLLQDAWKVLETYQGEEEKISTGGTNPGL